MAGDWIKMRNDLPEDPAVISMAGELGIDEFAVVGRLQRLWAWFDAQSRDGHASGVTFGWVDRKVCCDGFAQAMAAAGWLGKTDNGIQVPKFDRHNGESAKARATATKRKQKQRAREANGSPSVPDMSRNQRDKTETREELRRVTSPLPPDIQPPAGFEEFWAIYPKHDNQDAAKRAFAKLAPNEALQVLMKAAVQRASASDPWRREGGKFIPMASSWINGKRWTDEGVVTSATAAGAAPAGDAERTALYLREQAEHASKAVPPTDRVQQLRKEMRRA